MASFIQVQLLTRMPYTYTTVTSNQDNTNDVAT